LLWGVPSIVYGAFGFTIMIYFGLRASLLAGIITVTLFIIPIMVRAMDEVFKTVQSVCMKPRFLWDPQDLKQLTGCFSGSVIRV
jgi:phosphate transport system permease protein